jgi:serine/threonine protein kinase/Tol biopolymer transport system component
MAISAGTRLGSYEIIAALGAGGMGEVYRARDTKLKRDVAVKVLPDQFARDTDRVARFRREAEFLATLNHPNIAAVYGLEETDGLTALVLELVDGTTLADRIEQGPIPLDEALPIARQIANALEAAHEHGIIHRDLKPANVKLRHDGTVKVLDFGLAKSFEPTALPRVLTESPTVLSPAPTLTGVILGTAAYMSPEQARGKTVDKRTDIWAFGCVLFEMLTGQKPFNGETLTDMVAAIVKNEPDWRALPPGTPVLIRSLIARCLRKDPAQRLHDIADGRLQIEEALNAPEGAPAGVLAARNYREWAAWIAVLLSLGVALFFAARPTSPSFSGDPISFPVFPPEGTAFSGSVNVTLNLPSFALSPDGRALAFSAAALGARPVLWLRSMDQVGARQLAGTEDAQGPMWSPDSRWIGFFADGKLKKVPAAGGAVQVITQISTDFRGGTWGPEDRILFGSARDPIQSVSAVGGKPTPVTAFDESHIEGTHRNPQFLPDGQHFLYSIFGINQDQNGVYVGSLDGRTKKRLLPVNSTAVYAPPGYLLFVDGDTLLGQAFDAQRLEVEGQPYLVAEHVGRNSAYMSGVSASHAGTIAYAGTISQIGRLTWMSREGVPQASTDTPEGDYTDFRLSPDEGRLAASLINRKNGAIEIWLTDLARNSTFPVASGGVLTASALWSPDGARLAFRTNRKGNVEFYTKSAAGGGIDRPILAQQAFRQIALSTLVPSDWSTDGKIIFSAPSPASGYDLWLLPLTEDPKPAKFVDSSRDQMHGNFSPDGHLVAYTSNESDKYEVVVETVPRSERKWSVSTNGGYEPRWRADGHEIYYLSDDRKLMAVSVGPGPTFGVPRPLFQTHVPTGVTLMRTHYVPSRDGQRFLVNIAADAVAQSITVVANWTATLKK